MGLIVGIQPVRVELAPDLRPAAVVFSLDGKPVARASASPWRADVDFGRELRPVEITAEAIDASGERRRRLYRAVRIRPVNSRAGSEAGRSVGTPR